MTSKKVCTAKCAVIHGALVLFAILPGRVRASDSAENTSAKIYTLFLGLDLTLERERIDCPVVGAGKDGVEILKNGNKIRIPSVGGGFKSRFSPQVGRFPLDLAKVQTQRIESRLVERVRDAMSQLILVDVYRSEKQEAAQNNARNTAADANQESAKAARGFENDAAKANIKAEGAMEGFIDSFASPAFATTLQGANLSPAEDTGVGGPFDAYEVNFEISSPVEVANVYGAFRAVVRDPANSRQLLPCLKLFDIGRLGPKARRFTVVLNNLPTGFAVEGYAVHLMTDGHELPTNLAKNRVELTEDEAHQFLILQYVQLHHQDSLPMAIVHDLLPVELRALIRVNEASATVELKVDQAGRITAIQQGPGVAITMSPELEAALRRVRFLPALLEGKPADGLGSFALSEFLR